MVNLIGVTAVLLVSDYITASKEYLMNRQIIFRL